MLADWMPNRDFLVDWPGRRDKAFKPGLSHGMPTYGGLSHGMPTYGGLSHGMPTYE